MDPIDDEKSAAKYDTLFEETAPDGSVFADKGALDPLAEPEEIVAREDQERELATILNGVDEGYLPPTVSIHGPPGTGKTVTTRRVCREFAARNDDLAIEYVNLKECRTLFSAANEIYMELTGERKQAYEGLDGVFEGIWTALEDYPAYTVVLLDEIDRIQHDSNYDPNEFLYRLLRGEGKLKRGIELSAWLLSNELIAVDLHLDSRVESVMSGESVFFGPYDEGTLATLLAPRLEAAFDDGALPDDARAYGVRRAAERWGDARKALTLFRTAGERANERGLTAVTEACIDDCVDDTDKAATIEKLTTLPTSHISVLIGIAGWEDRGTGEVMQPVSTAKIMEAVDEVGNELGERAVRQVVTDLETMGLVETWIDSRGREGRVKQHETTFDPRWVRDTIQELVDED